MSGSEILTRFQDVVRRTLPLARRLGLAVETIRRDRARVRLPFSGEFVRSGNTISGPIQMALADFAVYAALFGRGGDVEHAVTSNLSIAFLRRPEPGDLVAEARILRHGSRLVYGEASIASAVNGELVAHATATYALPPAKIPVDSKTPVRGKIKPRR